MTENKKSVDRSNFIDPSQRKLEDYILAMAFKDNSLADDILSVMEEEDFYDEFNTPVFRAIGNLREMGQKITTITVEADILADLGTDEGIPFDYPSAQEIGKRFKPFLNLTPDGLPDAMRRVKEDTNYRRIIDAAQLAIRAARKREGLPIEILSPLEEIQSKILMSGKPIIKWADELEREAQIEYDKMDRGEIVTIPFFYPEIDKYCWGGGCTLTDYVAVSGATSIGKTTFAVNMMLAGANKGIKDLYFTVEMRAFKIFSRVHSADSKIAGKKIAPNMTAEYGADIRRRLRETGANIATLPFGVVDNIRDMETVRKVTRVFVNKFGGQRIFIDYEGLFIPSKKYKGSPYERASIVSGMCKEISMEFGIPVIALNQLRRKTSQEKQNAQLQGATAEDGNEVEPTLEMLKESGAIENNADKVVFLWGEKGKEGEEEAIRDIKGKLAKNRDGGIGRFGLKFAPDIYTFSSPQALKELAARNQSIRF